MTASSSIQSEKLTITCLDNARWLKVTNEKTGRQVSSGACLNTIEVPINELQLWLQKDSPTIPSLRRIGYQVQTIARATDSATPEKGDIPSLPQLFKDSLPQWSLLSLKEAKKSLPAFVPSVKFNQARLRELALARKAKGIPFISPKRLCSMDASVWEHTGIFGIDIDLGDGENGNDPNALWIQATSSLPKINGYLFSYQSPSGGIKAFYKLADKNNPLEKNKEEGEDNFTSLDWHSMSLEERLHTHAVLFFHLSRAIQKESGLQIDPICKDIARLQFLWKPLANCKSHFPHNYSPWIVDPTSFQAITKEYKDHNGGGGSDSSSSQSILRPILTSTSKDPKATPIPDLIKVDFADWLEKSGRTDEAHCVREELSPAPTGDGWTSFCPCCKNVASGVRATADLMLRVDAENHFNAQWYCFHSSCHGDFNKVKAPMWRLWKMFVDQYIDKATELDELAIVKSTHNSTSFSGITQNLAKFLPTSQLQTILKGVSVGDSEPIKELSEPDSLNPSWPVTASKSMGKDLPPLIYPTACDANVLWYIINCLHLVPTLNALTDMQIFVPSEGGRTKNIEITDGAIAQIHGLLNRYIPSDTTKIIYRVIDATLYSCTYHPVLLASVVDGGWDGHDYLNDLLNTITVDPNWKITKEVGDAEEEEEEMEEDTVAFTRTIITRWLQCAYLRFDQNFNAHKYLGIENYVNIMPVLVGDQGIGKNRWVRSLLAGIVSVDEVHDLDPSNKDSLEKLAHGSIIHMDEIDSVVSNEHKISSLKAYLTKSQVSFRSAYGHKARTYITQASFIGSTNQRNFLIDETGSRRFVTLFIQSLDVDAINKIDKNQLWAQIKYICDNEASHNRTIGRFYDIEEMSNRNNALNSTMDADDSYLTSQLVYVKNGETYSNHGELSLLRDEIPDKYCSGKNILTVLRMREGNNNNPTLREARSFCRELRRLCPKGKSGQTTKYEYFLRRIPNSTQRLKIIPVMLKEDYLDLTGKKYI